MGVELKRCQKVSTLTVSLSPKMPASPKLIFFFSNKKGLVEWLLYSSRQENSAPCSEVFGRIFSGKILRSRGPGKAQSSS